MKKLILLSFYASFALSAVFTNPLPIPSKSTDNGGPLSAIDAYKDGVGAMMVTQGRGIDNSAMNILVFKYGTVAKANGLTIPDQILLTGTTQDKALAGAFYTDGSSCILANKTGTTWLSGVCQGGTWTNNGTSCNDNNSATTGETWLNGVCQGGILDGTSCSITNKTGCTYLTGICQGGTWTNNGVACDDGNSATTGETWLNGVCQGGVLGNVAGNGLIYDNCEGGARNWTDAGAYCSSKGSGWRLPTLAETSNQVAGGVPQCSATTWSWTSTPIGYGYYVWSASSYNSYYISYVYGVRCVK